MLNNVFKLFDEYSPLPGLGRRFVFRMGWWGQDYQAFIYKSFGHCLADLQIYIISANYKNREARRFAKMKVIMKTRSFEYRPEQWLSNFTFHQIVW